jgi:toxin ParE1/3/4
MPRVVVRPAAISDLNEIAEYIEDRRPGRGFSFVDEIRSACSVWAGNPMAGRARIEIGDDIRSFPHGNYIVFYRPLPDGIAVLRVLHGARDIARLF